MNQVLLINASAQGAASHANRLALDLVACLRQAHPALALVERPVGTDPLPALSQAYVQALTTATPFDAPELALSETLIRELEQSDALLIATPLHNFTLPAALKLWIDYVLRIHRTFQSSAEGKLGLLADRPVYVLV
ncbi:FMN-dependent NADH-azoreductase [Aeromonas dhakensis]|uniref:FMN-dependent NADH-azoreductase n=2 Tax=Aeromonadaceae TaxID=84642 RepID=UPI003985D7AF